MTDLKVSNLGDKFIQQSEGTVLTLYKDSVKDDTIGTGHEIILPTDQWVLDQNGIISQEQSDTLYINDKIKVENYLNNVICKNWFMPPKQYQFDGLADFIFQYGDDLINRFPDTYAIFTNGVDVNIIYALTNWFNNAKPENHDGLLIERRTREVKLFRDGQYS